MKIALDAYLNAIFAITYILDNLNIPYTFGKLWDGYQLRFPWCAGDVVCHSGSYGHNLGYVESYRFPWDDGDVTVAPPQDMVQSIVNYYDKIVKESK